MSPGRIGQKEEHSNTVYTKWQISVQARGRRRGRPQHVRPGVAGEGVVGPRRPRPSRAIRLHAQVSAHDLLIILRFSFRERLFRSRLRQFYYHSCLFVINKLVG